MRSNNSVADGKVNVEGTGYEDHDTDAYSTRASLLDQEYKPMMEGKQTNS